MSILLGFCLSVATFTSASATESTTRCDDMLIDLSSMQAALTQLEQAVDTNADTQDSLRAESSLLAATIADKIRDGASNIEIEELQNKREAVLSDLADHEKLRPTLVRQRDALTSEVDTAERGYIACVESTL